jgi:hypothetical protein
LSGDMQMEEKSRTCPSCRCSISVLATKCRFCGEVVGKPKVEVRQLSVDDLGGESVTHRAVSSSVIEALDEMRKESGGSDGTLGSGDGGIDLSGLDGLDQPAFRVHTPKVRVRSMSDKIMTAVKIIVVLSVISIAAVKLPGLLSSGSDDVVIDDTPVHVNAAPEILARDGDLIEALTAAMQAKQLAPSAENDKIADDVLDRLIAEIDGILNATPWEYEMLNQATSLANRTSELYPTARSSELKSTVEQEFIDYSMILLDMDLAADTAMFQLNNTKVTVKTGDVIADRFKVTGIKSAGVYLQDIKRNNRRLSCEMARGPR